MAESFLAAAAQRASDVATYSLLKMWTVALAELKPAPPPEVEHADVAFGRRWKLHTSRPTQGEQFFCEALKTALTAGRTSFSENELNSFDIDWSKLNHDSWIMCATVDDPYVWFTPMPAGPQLEVFDIQTLHEVKGRQAMLDALCKDGAIIFRPFSPPAASDIFRHCFDSVHKFNGLPAEVKAKAAPVRGTPPHGYVATPSMEVFSSKVHLKKGYQWPELKAASGTYGQSNAKTFAAALSQCQQMLASTARTVLSTLLNVLPFDGRARTNLRHLVDLETAGFEHDQLADSLNPNMATCSHSGMTIFSHSHGKPMSWSTDDSLVTVCPPSSEAMVQIRNPTTGVEWFVEGQLRPGSGEMLVFGGEALSYATSGRVPALMWRLEPKTKPTPATLADSKGGTTPGMSAMFRARCVRRADSLIVPMPPMPPLPVLAFERYSEEQKQERWPWRRHSAYHTTAGGTYLYTPPPTIEKKHEKKSGLKKGFFK